MRRFGKHASIATFLILLSLLFAACGSTSTTGSGTPTATTAPITVGIVLDTGGLNDGGFNQFSYLGYTKASKQFHFPDVHLVAASANDYNHDVLTVANQVDMVIGVGFNMEPAIGAAAQQFPNKRFAIIDGCASDPNYNCISLPNVATLFFKEQQAGCLVGALAGQMEVDGKAKASKLLGHNTIGAVGGLAIPPVIRYIAGYKYCAKMVDPSVNVVIGYSNNFADPTKCSAIADKQFSINQADILFQVAGNCGNGVLDSADHHNIYSIGVDSDQSKLSTGAVRPSVITSAIKRVDTAAFDIINLSEQQGKNATGQYTTYVKTPFKFDLSNDGVGFATPSSDVPADAVAKAMTFETNMKNGSLTPPEAIPTP